MKRIKYDKTAMRMTAAAFFSLLLSILLILYDADRLAFPAVLLICAGAALIWLSGRMLYRRSYRFLCRLEALAQHCDPDEYVAENAVGVLQTDTEALLDQLASRLAETSAETALKTEAELHALQNQINPHFLYNTLEIIRSRALAQGCTDVAEMVESLARQFRYCINNQGEMASLQQELDHVHNYLLIQRYRFGDRFRYREFIGGDTEKLLSTKLPVMTLQPIIENALVHGVSPCIDGGCITLRVRATARRLHIAIEDDGVGMTDEEVQKIRRALQENTVSAYQRQTGKRSMGIAMRNVNQRIRFYFGENYGVDIASTQGVGTSVFVTLPLI